MTSSTQDEHWRKLCEAIVEEPDSNRLMELVNKLNSVLEKRESEFKRQNDDRSLSQRGGA